MLEAGKVDGKAAALPFLCQGKKSAALHLRLEPGRATVRTCHPALPLSLRDTTQGKQGKKGWRYISEKYEQSNRHMSRVERDATHCKQRIGALSTRHYFWRLEARS